MHLILWSYEVRPEQRAAFLQAYGPGGAWDRLFRRAPGFLGLELLEDGGRFLTIDRWESEEAYLGFKSEHGHIYEALDGALDALTANETRLGGFSSVNGQGGDLAAAVDAAARLKGSFRLRSGAISSEYFDKYRFEADPQLLRRVAGEMARLVPSQTQVLAGLELGGVPIATAMSLHAGLPVVFVRKTAKDYGTRQAVEGGDVAGRIVTIVEDVVTTGGAVVQAAGLLQEAGAQLAAVVCAIWRGEGAPSIAALPGVPVLPALTREELDLAKA